jgi:cytochrome c biogenesis protein CcdA
MFLLHITVNANPEGLQFYVISCPTCEGYKERVRILEDAYPQGAIVFYNIEDGDNAQRFKRIAGLLDETLYMPLVGVFEDGGLTAIASGSLSSDDWRMVVEGEREGVHAYVAIVKGQIDIIPLIDEPGKVKTIARLFTEPDISVVPSDTGFLQLLAVVATAATMDAINPCCFSIFVVLLTFVFYGVGKKAVLRVGLAFTAGIFVAYLLLGLGFREVLRHVPEIKYVVTPIALVLGVLRIMEALGKEVKHIPGSFAGRISKRIEGASNPRNGFGAGIVTGFLMLPCSSAPYFIVLSLLSERASYAVGLAFLLLYNLIVILPFLMITVVVYGLVRSTMDLKLWSLENRRWLNLLIGVGLILLSVLNLLV